ncbi:MAG: RluA family pseudouridine synthase [Cyanobacteria bacterium HKST-UBA04]|nr:RluA family pseudouridine synthase [Cyanobacteria bacterium HKST-UBA04]
MSGVRHDLLVEGEEDGLRLDRFMALRLPQYSREYLKGLIQEGRVTMEGQPVTKPALAVEEDQTWFVEVPEPKPLALQPENLPIDVVYEDEALLVVNKPSGMLTHPAGAKQTGTLVNALLYHCQQGDGTTLSGINGVERPGIVHRLDADTSGLLVVAKTDGVHRALQQALQARTIKRQYRCVVQLPKGVDFNRLADTGTIETAIGRDPKRREKMAVLDGQGPTKARFARTHWYKQSPVGNRAALLSVVLDTGRTHQIRVHMAHVGMPVFNDPLYGNGWAGQLQYPYGCDGQVLQACALSFEHPATHQPLSFECPPDACFERAVAFLDAL